MPAHPRRQAFGQHFLRDRRIIDTIVDRTLELARETQATRLLEIGPGQGALTERLLAEAGVPIALCEMDRVFSAHWKEKALTAPHGATVIDQDFLKVAESAWLPESATDGLGVVSNLPYSSGTAILTQIAEHPSRVRFMVLMFQREVAHRLRAQTGSKAWGSLSLWIQNRWDVRTLCPVPPRAFMPPPDVESEVVELTPRATPRLTASSAHPQEWQELLRIGFAHRRKMLRSSIPAGTPARIALDASGLDGTKRAEALTWEEWGRWLDARVQGGLRT